MAELHELIERVADEKLREELREAADKLLRQKKFGLVFEDHKPEYTPLYEVPVKKGSRVSRKYGDAGVCWKVLEINDGMAVCQPEKRDGGEIVDIPVDELVSTAKFGEPIYPYLRPIDMVCNTPDNNLWHTLIEADNYHALQLLEYLYAGKVDCIYIDPPYNTGAKDWKYNNDYVDGSDIYRHSKWLSMMEKRLKIAKRLLNPENSVLIITIDEKEYLHLGCLLEEMFSNARIQIVSTMINPAVVSRVGGFGRCGEYIFFVLFGNASPDRVKLDREWVSNKGRTHTGNIRWDLLKRSGTGATRKDSPGGFYPIYINPDNGKIVKIGLPLPDGVSEAPKIDNLYCLLPIRNDGTEGRWQWTTTSLEKGLAAGRVKVGGNEKRGFTIYILKDGEYSKILNGEFEIRGHGINNEIIVDDIDTEQVTAIPGDIWKISSHDSTQYGSRLLGNIFLNKRFTFPKSLYAVKDCLYFFTANKPDALIVDFFAGSGTTLHAVNLLNAEDGGHRRCVLVTNNEVSADEAKSLAAQGYQPGDEEWEKLGIARYVTWPRTVCSIEGHDVNGQPLKGTYLGSDLPMADGFQANAAYFKLGFLDKTSVALGQQFRKMLPALWMKAGAIGPCPALESDTVPSMLVLPENGFAILAEESAFDEFAAMVNAKPEIETVYIITDYETGFEGMAKGLKTAKAFQLYRDYLNNFRINAGRDGR